MLNIFMDKCTFTNVFYLSVYGGPHVEWSPYRYVYVFLMYIPTYVYVVVMYIPTYTFLHLFLTPCGNVTPRYVYFLLCIYDSCLCHCYGYTNICFLARFYGNMIEWSKIKVCLWHYYVYNSTCSWYCYVYTNNCFLELNPVGMQFDKEHSQGLVWGRQVSRYCDEVW